MYNHQLEALMAQRYTVDYIALKQTSLTDSFSIFKALLQARAIQKQQMNKLEPDDLENLMMHLQESSDEIQDIHEIMSRDYVLTEFDESQLEEDLSELEVELNQEILKDSTIQVPSYLPAISVAKPGSPRTDEINNILMQ